MNIMSEAMHDIVITWKQYLVGHDSPKTSNSWQCFRLLWLNFHGADSCDNSWPDVWWQRICLVHQSSRMSMSEAQICWLLWYWATMYTKWSLWLVGVNRSSHSLNALTYVYTLRIFQSWCCCRLWDWFISHRCLATLHHLHGCAAAGVCQLHLKILSMRGNWFSDHQQGIFNAG